MSNEDLAIMIARLETTLTRIDHILFGNGQPGELDKMQKRIKVTEEFRSSIRGALAVLTFLMTIFGGMVVTHIINHGL